MKASELRIGNLVYKDGMVVRIALIKDRPVHKSLNPIPLTGERLIEFGFEKDNETRTWSILTPLQKFDYLFELEEYYDHFEPTFLRIEIEYVHQLQNLYFALTGEELKIKEQNHISEIDMTVGKDIQSIIDTHISVIEDFKASESRRIYAMNEYLNKTYPNE